MSDSVRMKPGGHLPLFCYRCGEWVPNTSPPHMAEKGFYSHSHDCREKEQKEYLTIEELQKELKDEK